jgi:hypothetical protein
VSYTLGYNPSSQLNTRTTSNDAYVYIGSVNVNRSYAVNGLNQYTSAGPATFTYDPNGNLTGNGNIANSPRQSKPCAVLSRQCHHR